MKNAIRTQRIITVRLTLMGRIVVDVSFVYNTLQLGHWQTIWHIECAERERERFIGIFYRFGKFNLHFDGENSTHLKTARTISAKNEPGSVSCRFCLTSHNVFSTHSVPFKPLLKIQFPEWFFDEFTNEWQLANWNIC